VVIAAPEDPLPPVPDEDRYPVPAETDSDAVELAPITIPAPTAPGELPEGAELKESEGGETFDVYAYQDGAHIAQVFAGDVNFESENGKWLDLALTEDETGFVGVTGEGGSITVRFPAVLSAKTPVSYEGTEGSLLAAPVGVAETKAVAEGLSVTYSQALSYTDFTYTLTSGGYKETVVLQSGKASPALAWELQATGLSLSPSLEGGIDLLGADGPIGSIDPAVVTDASGKQTTGVYGLEDLGAGSYVLSLVIDPLFLAEAAYPVVVDPGVHDNSANPEEATRDGYTDSSKPNTSYETANRLWVGNSPNRHTFVKFDIESLKRDERIIYSALMYLFNVSGSGGSVEARWVDTNWPSGNLKWNNQPTAGSVIDTDHGMDNGWAFWELEEQYQHHMPNVPGVTFWANNGSRLAKPSGASAYEFYSKEAIAGTDGDPFLVLSWNDLPNAPDLKYPNPGDTIEHESPTLRTDGLPNDYNGDKRYINFQISDDGSNWTGSHLVHESGWLKEENSYTVPAGVLTDGQQYFWRPSPGTATTSRTASATPGRSRPPAFETSPSRSSTTARTSAGGCGPSPLVTAWRSR